jgi:hypothetical protein
MHHYYYAPPCLSDAESLETANEDDDDNMQAVRFTRVAVPASIAASVAVTAPRRPIRLNININNNRRNGVATVRTKPTISPRKYKKRTTTNAEKLKQHLMRLDPTLLATSSARPEAELAVVVDAMVKLSTR